MLLATLLSYVQSVFHNEEGQDLIEYSMIIVVIVLVAMVGMAALGGQIAAIWAQITGALGGG
ncbi:MAG: Flp family type IVb pilin [Caldilineaceae bacterium]|nr:Flp family type IVb pilin [Caldilineaceae bacterium]